MSHESRRWSFGAAHLADYMRRWLLRTPWFSLRLHNILTSDQGRDEHDHPFSFVSLILKGGYIEHRPGCICVARIQDGRTLSPAGGPCRFYGPGSVVRRHAKDLHRLELVSGPAWTLVVSGAYHRVWGFQTPHGWVPFTEYSRSFYAR